MQFSSDQLRTLLLHAVRSAMVAGGTALGLREEFNPGQPEYKTHNQPVTCGRRELENLHTLLRELGRRA